MVSTVPRSSQLQRIYVGTAAFSRRASTATLSISVTDQRRTEIEFARAVGAHLGRGIKEISPSLPPLKWYEDWAARYRDFPHYPNTVMVSQYTKPSRMQAAARPLQVTAGTSG